MKQLHHESVIDVPEKVRVFVRARQVTVKGPRGVLRRDFRHLAVELSLINGGKQLKAELWFGSRKAMAYIRTVTTHIKNMIKGVTKGFQYKMRLVYAHFPISVTIEKDGKEVNIRNFLGEKIIRNVAMFPGVTVERSSDVKDELVITGNSLENVSQSAANIHGISRVRNKDIRKFLDGVYVSSRGLAVRDE